MLPAHVAFGSVARTLSLTLQRRECDAGWLNRRYCVGEASLFDARDIDPVGSDRLRKMIPLTIAASEFAQRRELVGGLDAFGDEFYTV